MEYYCPNCEEKDGRKVRLFSHHPSGGFLIYNCALCLGQFSLTKLEELKATPVENMNEIAQT